MKIIKIGAVWCPGCLVMQPRWKEIEVENPELSTVYFDFDQDEEQVKPLVSDGEKLPIFIFQSDEGSELKRLHGEISKREIMETITEVAQLEANPPAPKV